MTTLLERLERSVIPVTECGCWIWTGHLNGNGYGRISVNGRNEQTHRVSWSIHRGPIPNGQHVLHHCDVRCCVNPDHLFLGTRADNMQDMIRKGRQRLVCGSANRLAKLTEADVSNIRASALGKKKLATIYGVSTTTIAHIRKRKTWRAA